MRLRDAGKPEAVVGGRPLYLMSCLRRFYGIGHQGLDLTPTAVLVNREEVGHMETLCPSVPTTSL